MKFKLIQKKKEAGDAVTFIFEPPVGFSWRAGQYLHYTLRHPNPDSRGEKRYFTISSAPFTRQIWITTRVSGDKTSSFKKYLSDLTIGGEIEAEGPEGDFILESPVPAEYIFIAGGIGITPFHSILTSLNNRGVNIKVKILYANKTEEIIFKDELESLASWMGRENIGIYYFVGSEKLTMEKIRAKVPDFTVPIFYLSGPEPMVEAFEKELLGAGVPEARLIRDYFPGYDWP